MEEQDAGSGPLPRHYHSHVLCGSPLGARHQPHFHAYFSEYAALFSVEPPALYEGAMPRRQQNIFLGWAEVHQQELMENWQRARTQQPVLKIEGTL
jgi:hypothetical protein